MDRLEYLSTKLESGEISDRELDELEALLADDYEARERFLDHSQIEGVLFAANQKAEDHSKAPFEKIVQFEGSEAPRRAFRFTKKMAVLVACLTLGLLIFSDIATPLISKFSDKTDPTAKPEAPANLEKLSPDEHYDRTLLATVGGASNAHPETANLKSETTVGEIEFNRDVRPILSDKCIFCHGPDAAKRKADLRLDTEEGALESAIVAGDADASEVIARIFHDDPDELMPPPESSRTLTETEKVTIKKWIEHGAKWQKHWAFVEPKKTAPAVTGENEIDFFVGNKLREKGFEFSPEAERETLIRRVTLDLTGVPPTLTEVDAFVGDESPDSYEKVVNRLLKSPRYAERMTWQWLEAARYADTDGYQNDGPRSMWRWRDWVLNAYGNNMPFDQFTIEQLAGDLLPNPTEEQLIATAFNRNHRYNSEAGLVLEEFLLENAVDRVDTTSTVWMGVTMGCCRCHDHKYDPFSQREYYQLISYFDAVPESGRAIKQGNSEPWITTPTASQKTKLSDLDERLKKAEATFAAFSPEIEIALTVPPTAPLGKPIVSRGLTLHFGSDAPIIANGKDRVRMSEKPLAGLMCSKRFSIAFRMEPQDVKSGAVLSTETAGTTRNGILVNFRNGHLRYTIISRWIAGVGMLETIEKFEPGESVHITLTNDGTQRTQGMKLYVNGKPVKTREIHNTMSNPGNNGAALFVGGSTHVGNWKGEISDLRLYNTRTLAPEEALLLTKGSDQRRHFLEHSGPKKIKKAFVEVGNARLARQKYIDSLPTTMIMVEGEKTEPTRLRVRGEYHNKGEPVHSDVPEVFPEMPGEFPKNRLGLAKWLVNGKHPLTGRVAVNRYWQMFFGTGLVRTSEDFGTQGSLPSHPELLDFLATDFAESGWDVQAVLKTIVMSRTYRQSSKVTSDLRERDPNNTWLARAPRLKLSGNALRDQALFASGLLVEQQGGPSVKPYQPAKLWAEASNVKYVQDKGDALHRRSLYTYWKRTLAPPSMAVLDTADREWCSVKPKRTNTPLQALTLMNETAFFEAARKLGERILREGGDDSASRVDFAFRAVLSRSANDREREILTAGFEKYLAECAKDPEFSGKIQNVGESKTAPDLDPVELGAATAMANVILNLEEASVKE